MYTKTLHVNLDEIPCYSKVEIAKHQLERAILLFLDEKDYISSITLAGASEEILGKVLKENKIKNEVDEVKESFAFYYGVGWKEHETWLVEDMNYHRNHLKHIKDGEYVSIYPEAAIQMIGRAVNNLLKLDGNQSDIMKRYFKSQDM